MPPPEFPIRHNGIRKRELLNHRALGLAKRHGPWIMVRIRTLGEKPMRSILVLLAAVSLFSVSGCGAEKDAPKPEVNAPLERIAFGSCCRQNEPAPIWDAIADAKPQLFLFLGDTIYADTTDLEVMKAEYKKLSAKAGYKKLLATCPVLATWDDHDFGSDDLGADNPIKKEAQQAFLDFLGEPGDSPRRKQEGVYESKVFGPKGKDVQVILLDLRYFRGTLKKKDPLPPLGQGPYIPNEDPKSSMLGEMQWKWLEEQLKAPARVRILGSSVQFATEEEGWEKWANLPLERARLLKLLKDTKAGGVIVISGDKHMADLSKVEPKDSGLAYPLYDLTSSSLNNPLLFLKPGPNKFRVGEVFREANSGWIGIDWAKDDPEITLEIRDEKGATKLKESLKLSALQP